MVVVFVLWIVWGGGGRVFACLFVCLFVCLAFWEKKKKKKKDANVKLVLSRVILLLLLIARSKLVPDFALTLHAIHLVVVSVYSRGLPRNALWWGLNALSVVMMTVGGVWSCRWRELRPISFGTGVGDKGVGDRGEYEMVGRGEEGRVDRAEGSAGGRG